MKELAKENKITRWTCRVETKRLQYIAALCVNVCRKQLSIDLIHMNIDIHCYSWTY